MIRARNSTDVIAIPVYARNRFEDINGKCIDLDGFHDGVVRGNICVDNGNYGIVMNNNNPDMRSEGIRIEDNLIQGGQYRGIFVMGTGHTIVRNRLLDLNRAHRLEDLLRAGIYLGNSVVHWAPARGGIRSRTIGVSENRVARNVCTGADRREAGPFPAK